MGTLNAKGSTSSLSSFQCFKAKCSSTVSIEKFVYLVDSIVNKVELAIANDKYKSNVVGMVVAKSTATSCIVQSFGKVIKNGLLVNKKIFLSTSILGEVQYHIPTESGTIIKQLGYTISENEAMLNIEVGGIIRG